MKVACSCHGWVVMLHTPLSWCCTTRQNTKGYCWFYADLDVLPSGNDFFFPVSIMIFPNILICLLSSQRSHFFTISSYIVTLQSFGGCLTISIVYVHFWKEAQKKPTVSTNQVFILRLLLTALITELRKFASYPHDISPCCYA